MYQPVEPRSNSNTFKTKKPRTFTDRLKTRPVLATLTEIEVVNAHLNHLQAHLNTASPVNKAQSQRNQPDWLRQNAQECLAKFHQTVEILTADVDNIPFPARTTAQRLLKQAHHQLTQLTTAWADLSVQGELTDELLQAFIQQIFKAQAALSLLKRRHIHHKNLELLEERLAGRATYLPNEVLQKYLQPHIKRERDELQALKTQQMTHRRNLELYRQMLAGERPYAPVVLFNQISDEEKVLKNIDLDLGHSSFFYDGS